MGDNGNLNKKHTILHGRDSSTTGHNYSTVAKENEAIEAAFLQWKIIQDNSLNQGQII